jgi:hypothetical protein
MRPERYPPSDWKADRSGDNLLVRFLACNSVARKLIKLAGDDIIDMKTSEVAPTPVGDLSPGLDIKACGNVDLIEKATPGRDTAVPDNL